jgi:hypothetical protein
LVIKFFKVIETICKFFSQILLPVCIEVKERNKEREKKPRETEREREGEKQKNLVQFQFF